MHWFFKLFRRPVVTTPPPAPERPSPVDGDFRPAPWLVERALGRVLAGTGGLEPVGEKLLRFLHGASAADGTAAEAAIADILEGTDWSWPELDSWTARFVAEGAWPSTWQRYPSLLLPFRSPPATVAEALPGFSYLDLRDLLRPAWPAGERFPIRIEELQAAFVARMSWEAVAASAQARFRSRQEELRSRIPRDRAALLLYHLRATIAGLVTWRQWEDVGDNRFLAYRLEVACPEGETLCHPFRECFNGGDTSRIPPFFPGDPSRLRLLPRSRERKDANP